MTSHKSNIDTSEMILLLFIVRIFAVLTFSAKGGAVNGLDEMLVLLGTFAVSFLLIIPLYFLIKLYPGKDIVDCTAVGLGQPAAKVTAALLWLFCIYTAASTSSTFEFFITTAVYPKNSHWIILITFLAACLYASTRGIEPIARVGIYIFFASMLSYFFILLALAPQVRLSNFTPLLSSSAKVLGDSVFYSMGLRVDTILFLMLIPQVKGRLTRAYVKVGVLALVVFELLTFITVGSLGNYLSTQIFPYYSAASVAEVSFFQRLDSLHMAIWVLVSFIRASLFLLVGSSCLNKLLPLRLHKFSPWITTGATLVLSLIISHNVRILYATINFWVTVVPVMVLGTVLPVVLVIIGAVRKHKEASQCAS
ncbi:MAG: GerAB/ArcD/ProY family transporter [Oscillospiraceae bacterium]